MAVVSRLVAGIVAACLLFVSGPGWAALFCGCGDAPKAECSCCDESQPSPPGAAIEGRLCHKVEVGKADPSPAAPALDGVAIVAPPVVASLAVLPAPAPRAPVALVVATPFQGGDPPFLRLRSLRC